MKTKKLISAVAAFALAANLGLASVAFAASTGTGSAAIGGGGYTVNVETDSPISLITDAQSNNACDDGPLNISLTAYDSCGNGNIIVQDLEGVNTDRTINFQFNQPLTDSASSVALPLTSTSGFGIDIDDTTNFIYDAGGAENTDFSSVMISDKARGSAPMLLLNTDTAVINWAKGGSILNFSVSANFTLQQDIPDSSYGLADGTYTNTITFTAS